MTADAQTVSDRIVLARQSRGLSQTGFATALHVHPSQVSRWERGLTPSLPTLRSIASLAECSVGWLADGEGRAPTSRVADDDRAFPLADTQPVDRPPPRAA